MPVHIILSDVVIVDKVPFCTVISLALLNPATASENVRVTVAISPAFNALSLNTKDDTVGAVVSIVKVGIVNVDEVFPAASVTVMVIPV